MTFLWITLIVFLVLVGVSVLIGGVVYLIQRLRSGTGLVLPMRFLLRLYLNSLSSPGSCYSPRAFPDCCKWDWPPPWVTTSATMRSTWV